MTSRLAQARADLEAKNTELSGALTSLQESRQRLELMEQLKGELSKFVPESVKKMLEESPNATELEKKTVEVSVLFLDNIENFQSSWLTQGLRLGQVALRFGANDMGSIMIEENVVSAAGAHDRAGNVGDVEG